MVCKPLNEHPIFGGVQLVGLRRATTMTRATCVHRCLSFLVLAHLISSVHAERKRDAHVFVLLAPRAGRVNMFVHHHLAATRAAEDEEDAIIDSIGGAVSMSRDKVASVVRGNRQALGGLFPRKLAANRSQYATSVQGTDESV